MALWTGSQSNPKRRPSLSGAVMVDVANGSPRIRAWPRARGKKATEGQKAQQEWFRQASWTIKFMVPDMMVQIMEARQGKPILPRDLAMMMLSGRLGYIALETGRKIWPEVAINDVSESLDVISQLPGTTLMRGENQWISVPFPTPGNAWWFQPPNPAGWTYLTGATTNLIAVYDSVKGTSVDMGPPVAGDRTRCVMQTIQFPNAFWQLDFNMAQTIPLPNWSGVGIILRDTISGRLVSFTTRGNLALDVSYWPSLTGFASAPFQGGLPDRTVMDFWRVTSDGTTLRWLISPDGINYVEVWNGPLTAYLSNRPQQIGFGGQYNRTTGFKNLMNIRQWKWIQ